VTILFLRSDENFNVKQFGIFSVYFTESVNLDKEKREWSEGLSRFLFIRGLTADKLMFYGLVEGFGADKAKSFYRISMNL